MMLFLRTFACWAILAQPPAPTTAGVPDLRPGTAVRITTSRETLVGVVEAAPADDFLRLRVAGTATPTYVRLSAIETIRTLPPAPVGAAPAEAAPPGPDANRHLVYVHGICRHTAGYSRPWWQAMKPFTPQLGEANVHEVVWSDVVSPAMMAHAPGEPSPEAAIPPARTDEQRRLAEQLRAVLRDRAEQQAAEGGAGTEPPIVAGPESASPPMMAGAFSDSVACADDFVLYMTDGSIRERVLARFDAVVRPLVEAGANVEIISHSWGTVVSYEGLRRLAAGPTPLPGRVHNLFTVGSALSIWPVRANLAGRMPGGEKPRLVSRWVNLDARFDVVGGHIQGAPFDVDVERLGLAPAGCTFPVSPVCAHGSYFSPTNFVVNRDIFGLYIGQ